MTPVEEHVREPSRWLSVLNATKNGARADEDQASESARLGAGIQKAERAACSKTFEAAATYRRRCVIWLKITEARSLRSAARTQLRIYAAVAEANAQKGTRPSVGIGPSPSPPPLFSMISVITADTPVDANSIHSTAISPELA